MAIFVKADKHIPTSRIPLIEGELGIDCHLSTKPTNAFKRGFGQVTFANINAIDPCTSVYPDFGHIGTFDRTFSHAVFNAQRSVNAILRLPKIVRNHLFRVIANNDSPIPFTTACHRHTDLKVDQFSVFSISEERCDVYTRRAFIVRSRVRLFFADFRFRLGIRFGPRKRYILILITGFRMRIWIAGTPQCAISQRTTVVLALLHAIRFRATATLIRAIGLRCAAELTNILIHAIGSRIARTFHRTAFL